MFLIYFNIFSLINFNAAKVSTQLEVVSTKQGIVQKKQRFVSIQQSIVSVQQIIGRIKIKSIPKFEMPILNLFFQSGLRIHLLL
ncbi:hypothetical protein SAMN05421679_10278 [Epilithonimonas pallida]|uniref:Transmembrane protein n=1 Tax=Epilithonimonas pallida TaxID=373671 RepID=A0ABY1QZ86_9FLAO|nr:hypothetical protein SAMN05421679_10278 [Epilithonimonas pallida]